MTTKRYSYQPRAGHGLPHDPLNAIIGPRPIGWISSISASGQRNLAPYSFFNCFNYQPPIIGFASSGWKDSLTQLIQLQDASGNPLDSWLVLGEAVAIHIDESLLEEGIYQTARAEPVLRAGGPSAYYGISEAQRFDLVRPDARPK